MPAQRSVTCPALSCPDPTRPDNPSLLTLQKSAGGVLLSAPANESTHTAQLGEVLRVGEKVDLALAEGDTILYSKYGTSDVEVSEGKIVFVAQDSVLGVAQVA